jgi:hypothetical protein
MPVPAEAWAEWGAWIIKALDRSSKTRGARDAPAFFENCSTQERPMRTHRFGRKIKLPATIAIKHEIRIRMVQYETKKAEDEARAEGRQDGMANALIAQVGAAKASRDEKAT